MFQQEHTQKKHMLFYRFLGEYTVFLTSLSFVERDESSKKLDRKDTNFKKNHQS